MRVEAEKATWVLGVEPVILVRRVWVENLIVTLPSSSTALPKEEMPSQFGEGMTGMGILPVRTQVARRLESYAD